MKVLYGLFLTLCVLMFALSSGCSSSGPAADTRCLASTNPDSPDLDGDGIVNACDEDDDGDGAPDSTDNCPAILNSDQLDTNADGLGDACDQDNDGIENRIDNCPDISNTDQLDSNTNGIGDLCDIAVNENDFNFFQPVDLSNTSGHSYRPKTVVDSNDMIHVVWHDKNDETVGMDVWYTTVDPAGLIENEPVNISRSPAIANNAQMDIAPNGDIHVVYQDNKEGISDIFYTVSRDGGATFSPPVNISNQADHSSVEADIAIDQSGNIYVTWSGVNFVYVTRSIDSGKTFAAIPVQLAITSSVEPAIEADETNQVHLAWTSSTNSSATEYKVFYAKSEDGALTFDPVIEIQQHDGSLLRPDLAVQGSDVYLVWDRQSGKGEIDVWFAVSRDGGSSFSTAVDLTNNTGTSIMSVIEIAPDGSLYLTWTDTFSGNYDTYFMYSTDKGESFSEPLNIAPSAEGSLVLDMAIDSNNGAVIVWDDNRFGPFEAVLSYGNKALPVIKDFTFLPDNFIPSNGESLNFLAAFSEELDWELRIVNDVQRIMYIKAGAGSALNESWNGYGTDGLLAEPGEYTYTIKGVTRSGGVTATDVSGLIRVSTFVDPDAAPEISDFTTDQTTFSPNSDGRDEEAFISAKFNLSVDWKLQIIDLSENILVEETGTGPSLQYIWNGRKSTGESHPESSYTVKVTATNPATGESATDSFSIIIDLTAVEISALPDNFQSVRLSTNTPGVISFTISEGAVVTVYIYEANSRSLVNELARTSFTDEDDLDNDGDIDVLFEWDGTPGGGGTEKVAAGDYTVNIWVRDFGANRPPEYPILKTIQVIE